MIERLERIEKFTKDGQGHFLSNLMVQDAVYRNFEVIGEAAKNIPESVRKQYPEIPWRRMAGFRDVLIHQYDGVDPEEVWKALEDNQLSALRLVLQRVLDAMNSEAGL
ncbi:MAG: DUF86 domain-containing protein [Magnetococcales bacterium]|nr:DUF86 domain-containing protein [Magnetococcales bacterium]